jgi:tRNA_anti-like
VIGFPHPEIPFIAEPSPPKSHDMTDPTPSNIAIPAAAVAKPWYYRPFFVALLLVFFFPAGLWLMWSGKVFPMAVRVIVSVFIGLLIVGNAGGKRHGDGERGPSTGRSSAVAEVVPDLDAGTIVRAYDANELGGDATYKGKRFRISGTVDSVGKDIFGSAYVTINGEHPLRKVQCFLKNGDEKAKAAKLQPGQQIIVIGVVDGLMMNVLIRNSEIQ